MPDVSSPYTYAFSFSVAASIGKPRSDSEKSTLVDREEPSGRMQLAAADRHERAQPEEEVGERVEGAVERHVDRDDLVRRRPGTPTGA